MNTWQPPDLDEVRPDRFVINNNKIRPFLKGEGVTVGRFFELGTWRREGLIARLRERGFNVRTLSDRIAALPRIRDVGPPGAEGVRYLAPREQVAVLDTDTLRWNELPVIDQAGKPAIRIRANVALRRRKGRGRADHYISALARTGTINLLPASETDALVHAYGQIAANGAPRMLQVINAGDRLIVPQRQAILPPPHTDVLDRLAIEDADRWTFASSVMSLVETTLATLGLALTSARD